MIQFHSASYSIFGFTADVNNLGKMERNGSRNVTSSRRYAKNQTVRKWYPVVFALTNIMEIHGCCLLFEKKKIDGRKVKVRGDGNHSDHSSSSNSEESSSLSLHSTAIRRDRMAATSFPK